MASLRSPLPPGPKAPRIVQSLSWIREPVEWMMRCRTEYGPRFTLRFIKGRDYVFLSAPEDVKAVFASSPEVLRAGRANAHFRPFLGEGSLLTLDGASHKQHRHLLAPMLRGEALSVVDPTTRHALHRRLASLNEGEPLDMLDFALTTTLDIIIAAIFGVRGAERTRKVTECVHRLSRAASWLIVLQAPRGTIGPFNPWAALDAARAEFNALLEEEIADARRCDGARTDLLARIVSEADESSSPPSPSDLLDEFLTLLSAGHETTASTLAWAIHYLAGHPAILSRLVAMVRSDAPDARAFTEACVLEALRVRPPIPIVPRFVETDATINDLTIPAGTYLAAACILTHHDPSIFEDPARYDPERFFQKRKPAPYTFYPFGGGARLCIGNLFAVREATAFLHEFLLHVDIEPTSAPRGLARRNGLTLVPKDSGRVTISRMVRRLPEAAE